MCDQKAESHIGGLMEKKKLADAQVAKENRRLIREAALTLFSQRGFGNTTVADIAREAGVAVGTIYHYYKSKEDLLLAVVTQYLPSASLIEYVKKPTEDDVVAFLRRLFDELLTLGFDDIRKQVFLFHEAQRRPEFREEYVRRVLQPFREHLEQYIESRIVSGRFRPVDVGVVTSIVAAIILGMALVYLLEGEAGQLNRTPHSELVAKVVDFVVKGLAVDSEQQIETS